MLRLIVRIFLKSLAIMYVFPLLKGLAFHGNFYWASALAVFFSLLLSFMELLAAFFAAGLTVSTFGIALLLIIPIRILFFWVLPTVSLLLIAHCFPDVLTVTNWFSAALGALILLVIGLITRDRKN